MLDLRHISSISDGPKTPSFLFFLEIKPQLDLRWSEITRWT